MAGAVEVVVALAVLFVELDEALGDVGSEDAGLEMLFGPVVGVKTELDELALLGRKLAAADGQTDRRRVAADLRGEVELDDIAFLDHLVAGAGDRVTRRLLGEAVHRKTFVFRAVLVDALLGDADEFKLGLAGLELGHDRLGGELGDARSFADAGDFVRRLDAAQSEHDVVGPDDLGVRIGLADAVELNDVGVELGGDADADIVAGDAELLEDVLERLALEFGIGRVGALAVLVDDADALHPAEVAGEHLGLGTDHKGRFTVGGDRDADALEHRPEVGEVTGVGVVRLGTVDDENVKTFLLNKLRRAGDALFEFLDRNHDSCHFVFSFSELLTYILKIASVPCRRDKNLRLYASVYTFRYDIIYQAAASIAEFAGTFLLAQRDYAETSRRQTTTL